LTEIPVASAESTGRFFRGHWNFLFRSFAHLFVFFIQGMFFLSALDRYYQGRKTQKQIMIYAALLTAFCGILDELHQGLIPDRSCRLQDMIKDSVAGVLATGFWLQAKRTTKVY
jgi:VanZ family protein